MVLQSPGFVGLWFRCQGIGASRRHPEILKGLLGGAGDLVSKVIDRVIFGVTPFRVLITLLITYLLSPLPLQVRVGFKEVTKVTTGSGRSGSRSRPSGRGSSM